MTPRRPLAPVRLAALAALSLLAVACGGSSSSKGPALVSIEVTPAATYLGVGATVQFTATGTYSDTSTRDVTAEATWTSSDSAIASVSDDAGTKGLVTVIAQGPVTITARSGEISGTATFTSTAVVNTVEDTMAADGLCSLREALMNAQAGDQSGSTDCAAGGDPYVIRFDLPLPASLALAGALPTVVTSVTILGPEEGQLAVFGNDAVRLLVVDGGGTLSLSDLTLANGSADQGGAVLVGVGTVEVERATFQSNGATGLQSGGAIANLYGTVRVSASTFADSYGASEGGAIYNSEYGVLELDGCVFDANYSALNGGAISSRGTLTVTGCTFDGNTAAGASSGAIINWAGGTLSVTSSAFTHNSASSGGGAITNYGGTAMVTNSSFALNTAGGFGGGAVFNAQNTSSLAVSYSTFTGNTATAGAAAISNGYGTQAGGTATLTATLLSYNRVSTATVNCYNLVGATLQDGGNNLEDADTCGLGAGSWKSTDPGPLEPGDNGGGTQTLALSAGSAALDRIPPGTAGCGTTVATDQRGVVRPQGAGCDVGAYERE